MDLERVGPAERQVAQASRLAVGSNGLVEGQRFAQRRPDGPGVRPDGLKLANIVILLFGSRLQGPEFRDHLPADVQAAVPDRRQQPLVEADSVGVALEVPQLERKVPQGVRAVDDRDYSPGAGQTRNSLHREELGRQVGDVGEMKDLRLRRDRFLKPLVEIVLCRRHRELESCHLDPLAPHALVPGR